MGGNKVGFWRRAFNVCVTFFFVAMWHDINSKMVVYAAAISMVVFLELAATRIADLPFFASRREQSPEVWLHVGAALKVCTDSTTTVGP